MNAWTRHGDCNHCGHCCTRVARDVIIRSEEMVAKNDPDFYRVRGFAPVDIDGERRYVLFAWLDAPCPEYRDERCGIHDRKPRTCTEFPRVPADVVGTPCSYWFENAGLGPAVVRAGGTGSPYPMGVMQLVEIERVSS